jgi:hypothetical protein
VDLEDLPPAADVGSVNGDVSIESARSHQGAVEHVRPVRTGEDDDVLVRPKPVHLYQQLVERALPLVISAKAAPLATGFTNRVDLVHEDDTRRMLLRVGEQVSHARRANTDEHLDELGAGDGEERDAGLTRCGLGE